MFRVSTLNHSLYLPTGGGTALRLFLAAAIVPPCSVGKRGERPVS
jgi:hypothetical protein